MKRTQAQLTIHSTPKPKRKEKNTRTNKQTLKEKKTIEYIMGKKEAYSRNLKSQKLEEYTRIK